jgi:hypothetical protein
MHAPVQMRALKEQTAAVAAAAAAAAAAASATAAAAAAASSGVGTVHFCRRGPLAAKPANGDAHRRRSGRNRYASM